MTHFLTFDLILSAFNVAMGLSMMVFASRKHARAWRDRDARLAALDAGAKESYFEERRALETYTPPRTIWGTRLLGAVCFLTGVILLYLSLAKHP